MDRDLINVATLDTQEPPLASGIELNHGQYTASGVFPDHYVRNVAVLAYSSSAEERQMPVRPIPVVIAVSGHLEDFEFNLSIGVSEWVEGNTLDEPLDSADHKMYAVKAAQKAKAKTAGA